MDTNILLENGTNELEVLEFTVAGRYYGINVAKIREIIGYKTVTPVPNSHPCVEGIFMPRDTVITAIDLSKVLNIPVEQKPTDMMIVTNFNKLNIAFHVQSVVGIHRVSWKDIISPDASINSSDAGLATGIVKMEGKLIIILDFEKIITDISPETGLKVSDIDRLGVRDRVDDPILIAEDSPLLKRLIEDSLVKAGYVHILSTSNGQEAWDMLNKMIEDGTVKDKVKCIITDIEMPLMDGHRLTRLVKTNDVLKDIPLIIFSSLINDEMRIKGEALGANAQLTKPEIGNLVYTIDGLLNK